MFAYANMKRDSDVRHSDLLFYVRCARFELLKSDRQRSKKRLRFFMPETWRKPIINISSLYRAFNVYKIHKFFRSSSLTLFIFSFGESIFILQPPIQHELKSKSQTPDDSEEKRVEKEMKNKNYDFNRWIKASWMIKMVHVRHSFVSDRNSFDDSIHSVFPAFLSSCFSFSFYSVCLSQQNAMWLPAVSTFEKFIFIRFASRSLWSALTSSQCANLSMFKACERRATSKCKVVYNELYNSSRRK